MHITWAISLKFGVYVPCMKGSKAFDFDPNRLTPVGVMEGQRSFAYNVGDCAQSLLAVQPRIYNCLSSFIK